MYIPSAFRVECPDKLARFMAAHSFATLVTHDGQSSFASHLPILHRPSAEPHGRLLTHLARANPQAQHLAAGGEALVIFHGPHGYISPSWYETAPAVPTWNYAVVHAYGTPIALEDSGDLLRLIEETIEEYEGSRPNRWNGELPEDFRARLMQAIVGFEIPICRIEGKFKLGQNRSPADLAGVYQALSQSAHARDEELARLMVSEGLVTPPAQD
jgi:transcriptional regulator